jgi:hypothetical protein
MPKQPTKQTIKEHNLTHKLRDHGVPSAYRDVADHMNTHSKAADPSSKSISPFSRRLRISTQHRYDSHGHQNKFLSGNIGFQQSNCNGPPCQQHHRLHHGNGRTSAMVQGDNEPILQALGETVASKIRGIQTRHSPAYSSQSQASIERLHRTLFWTGTCHQRANGTNYGFLVGMQRPVMAYLIKHSVFSSTTTSSTVMEDFFKDGSQATTLPFVSLEKTFVGVRGQVIKTTTTNRQIKAWKYNRQLMEIINGTPWAPSPSRYNSDFVLPSTTSTPKQTEDKDITTQQQTPAIENQHPMEEGTTTSNKEKITSVKECLKTSHSTNQQKKRRGTS